MNTITIDSLMILDDETLAELAIKIKKQIKKFNFSHSKELEIDLCYIQREQEIRSGRAEYVR